MRTINVDALLASFDLRDLLHALLWEPSRQSRHQAWGPCPFCCPDKRRATCFSVSHLMYFCHRCSENGNGIHLVRKLHNLGFHDTVSEISTLMGIPIPYDE